MKYRVGQGSPVTIATCGNDRRPHIPSQIWRSLHHTLLLLDLAIILFLTRWLIMESLNHPRIVFGATIFGLDKAAFSLVVLIL